MNWIEELAYILKVWSNPQTPEEFNHDRTCFLRYCKMQADSASRDNQTAIAAIIRDLSHTSATDFLDHWKTTNLANYLLVQQQTIETLKTELTASEETANRLAILLAEAKSLLTEAKTSQHWTNSAERACRRIAKELEKFKTQSHRD